MSGQPFWRDSPEVWERVELAGLPLPGICRVTGDGMRLKIDAKKAAGRHGANVAFLGQDAVSFTIEVKMWTQAHLDAFEDIVLCAKPKAKYKEAKQSKLKGGAGQPRSGRVLVGYDHTPLTVSHPALALFGISACIVESVSIPTEQTPGLWTASLRCREFRPAEEVPVSLGKTGAKKTVGRTAGINAAIPEEKKPSETNSGPQQSQTPTLESMVQEDMGQSVG